MISGDEDNAYALADTMAGALASFAATGNPSTEALEWRPFTAEEHNTMIFDLNSELREDFDTALYDIVVPE